MVSAKLKPPLSDDEKETMIVTVPDKKATTQPEGPRAKIDQVGILSYITFAWIFEYLWSAYKNRVASDRSWPCSIFDSSNINTTRLEHLWNKELSTRPDNPSLFRVIVQFMRFRLIIACVVFLFCLIFGFIGPTCLVKGLISFSENPPRDQDKNIEHVNGLWLIFGILAVEISRVLMYGATWAISYRTGIRVRGAVLSLLYKSLLNSKSLRTKNSAEIVNICANDGQRIFDAVTFAPLVLMGPLVIIGGIVYLLKVIGPWSLLGLAVFVVFDVLQVFLGITLVRCRRLAVKNTEERLYLMGEILKNIKLIKMNCWEELFMQKVVEIRDNEKRNLRRAGYAQSIAIATGTIVPVVATIVTVLAVVYSGSDLLASDAFSAITVYFVMLFGIRMIPYGMRYLGEAIVAIKKIQQLLLFNKFELNLSDNHSTAAVALKSATFNWDLDPPVEPKKPKRGSNEEETALTETKTSTCLNDLSLTIEKREKIGICGPVGSGKSALLNSILGSTNLDKGTISIAGSIAYASQHPCIISGTVRENILFGQPLNTQRYDKAIHLAELTQDLEKMPSNDSTEVAERGAALSGGQKARLTLARCFYSNRDIYLLDDILSSTNKAVADNIFNNLMTDMLSNKTVLMVTSNPEYLSKFDRVVFLSNGSIQEVGSHADLLKSNTAYKEFFETKTQVETQEGEATQKQVQNGKAQNGVAKAETPVETYVTEEEDLGLSNISMDVYIEYIKEAGGFFVFGLILLLFIANVGSGIFSTVWLSKWMKDVHQETNKTRPEILHSGERSLAENKDITYYSVVYIISIVVLFITGLLKAMAFVTLSIKASTNLHNRMLKSVLHGIATFFDTTPTGRILNRFSKDLDEIDVKLPFSSEALLQYMITCLGFLLTIIWIFPLFLFAFFPLAAIFVLFFLCFRAGIRSLKRTENISRSPLFDHITVSLDGLSTIHAFGQNQRFFEGFKNKLDENSSAMFMFNSAMRWQAVWLDLLVVAISFFVSCLIVLLAGKIEPSDAGLALAFALQMSGVFQFAVRSQTELESKLTAVERVAYYYKNIEQEAYLDEGSETNANWPASGSIKFDDVVLRYRKNAPAALNRVSFDVPSGQKLGVFGRTGSGKSTLTNALYRLYPLENGTISIDSIDITKIGLQKLRKSMSIIPQESGLFTGTLRFNIDPTNEHSDDKLWDSLEKAGLKNLVSSTDEKLSLRIEDGGKNLSSGQRQLVCLARTLLRNVKIVILDEATSVLNSKTDEQIQTAIRDAFTDSTLILISHRSENIHSLDTSMEVDNGTVRINSTANSVPLEVPPKSDSEQTTKEDASEK